MILRSLYLNQIYLYFTEKRRTQHQSSGRSQAPSVNAPVSTGMQKTKEEDWKEREEKTHQGRYRNSNDFR